MAEGSSLPIPRKRRLGRAARIGGWVLLFMTVVCLTSLFFFARDGYYDEQYLKIHHTAPQLDETLYLTDTLEDPKPVPLDTSELTVKPQKFHAVIGTDPLGRSLLARCLLGGAISLGIGLSAAAISVFIGTAWGLISGYAGGRTDAFMMRTVDILYGLPYILLVLLLVVAVEGLMDRLDAMESPPAWVAYLQQHNWMINIGSLLVAIGAVSWLTLARVVRGQVLSLKAQPFVEAARATGCGNGRILLVHLLPNLLGPIIVYTTLTVPQAILQESFLSFLGIGVRPPLPSWGNLAAEGLKELNPVKSYWWLLVFPCVLLGVTLLSLNFLGDGLRDKYDPRHK